MTQEDLIYEQSHFCIIPRKTTSGKWVWFNLVIKITDERPEYYMGLLPEYSYREIK